MCTETPAEDDKKQIWAWIVVLITRFKRMNFRCGGRSEKEDIVMGNCPEKREGEERYRGKERQREGRGKRKRWKRGKEEKMID